MSNVFKPIATFDDYFVGYTNTGAIRAGVKDVMSKTFEPSHVQFEALVVGAKAAKCDGDLEELFFVLNL